MAPPAPPLFSTMTGCPNAFRNSGATSRARTSFVLPTIGTTMRTIFEGLHSWAVVGPEQSNAPSAIAGTQRRANGIFGAWFMCRTSDRIHGLVRGVGEMGLRPLLRLLIAW